MYGSEPISDTVSILSPQFIQMWLNCCITVINFLFNENYSSLTVFKAEQNIASCMVLSPLVTLLAYCHHSSYRCDWIVASLWLTSCLMKTIVLLRFLKLNRRLQAASFTVVWILFYFHSKFLFWVESFVIVLLLFAFCGCTPFVLPVLPCINAHTGRIFWIYHCDGVIILE